MADNVLITPGTGKTMAGDEVVDGTLGTVTVGFGKIMDGTLDSTNKLIVTASGAAKVDGSAVTQPVSLAANQSVNNAQINGVTPLMGNGATGTGSQRVTVASDNTPFAVKIDQTTPGTTNLVAVTPSQVAAGATGSVVPANASYNGLIAATANPTAATAGNLVGALADKLGKQVVAGSIRDLKGEQVTTITSSTTETTIVTAVASTLLDVYGLVIANSSATATKVTIRDATGAGTARVYYVPAGDMRGFMLPESAAVKQGTVNNNWTATCGTSVASIDIQVLYVKNI